MPKFSSSKGATAILTTFIISLVLFSIGAALIYVLTSETREVGYRGWEKKALYLAQAGIGKAMVNLQASIEATYLASYSVSDTLTMIDGLIGTEVFTGEAFGEGAYSVKIITVEAVAGQYRRYITFTATGFSGNVDKTIVAVVMFGFSSAKVFDYAYFINNYGWFYGGAQTFQGDVRANGNFTVRGAQKINGDVYASGDIDESAGSFFYDSLDRYYTTASGRARPGDPPAPGEEAFPGGYDGFEDNYDTYGDTRDPDTPQLHVNADVVDMPYLGDLSYYKELASTEAGTISQGGIILVDGVYDGTLVLIGTTSNPIEINGPVVVTEDVVIKGVVKGQGTIYAGRNTHIIGDVTYSDPPVWPKPDYDPESSASSNVTKDFLSLCTKGNVVIGDYNRSNWNYVKNYIKPPFTSPYVVDASDADIGYVSYYYDGEPYFDGDYTAYDGGTKTDGSSRKYYESSLSDPEFASYNPAANINQIDALVYTNHLVGGRMRNANFNGSVIGRDEGIVFSGYLTMNYDYRVKEKGNEYVDINLPLTVMDPECVSWREK